MATKIYNPQLARQRCEKTYVDPVEKDADDIVEYGLKQVVKKVGDGEDDYVLEEKTYEVSRVNRQAWIAKDAGDVGILNIVEKVRRSGDFTLFNQTHTIIPEGLQDYTNIPEDPGELLRGIGKGADSFQALKAVFGDVSFETLANMSSDEMNSYLVKYLSSQTSEKQEEGENK